MRHALIATFALLFGACASGYLPPISEGGAPSAAPSVAIDSAWTQRPPHSYSSSSGRMFAVYTNAVVGGSMFFDAVPSDQLGIVEFSSKACANLAEERGVKCSGQLMRYPEGHAHDAAPYATETRFTDEQRNRYGMLVVRPMLGEGTRYMACTGVWSLYGSAADRKLQQDRSTARLVELCRSYSGH